MLNKEKSDRNFRDQWFVSIYLPLDQNVFSRNRNRLRKLMFEAEKKLLELGMQITTVAKMLLPIEEILDNTVFWKNQSQALALFLSAQTFSLHSFPFDGEEMLVISRKFHLTPFYRAIENKVKVKEENSVGLAIFSHKFAPQPESSTV